MQKKLLSAASAALLVATISGPAVAASELEGVWRVTDTDGKPFIGRERTCQGDSKRRHVEHLDG
jgi:hypothetical protein